MVTNSKSSPSTYLQTPVLWLHWKSSLGQHLLSAVKVWCLNNMMTVISSLNQWCWYRLTPGALIKSSFGESSAPTTLYGHVQCDQIIVYNLGYVVSIISMLWSWTTHPCDAPTLVSEGAESVGAFCTGLKILDSRRCVAVWRKCWVVDLCYWLTTHTLRWSSDNFHSDHCISLHKIVHA